MTVCQSGPPRQPQSSQPGKAPTLRDDELLEDLSRRSFQYFWEQSDPGTGLTRDRARIDGLPHDERHRDAGSIAATGFALTGLCIAAKRGWIERPMALERAKNTLRFFAEKSFNKEGWFYHWVDIKTGERIWNSELSSIDSALLLAGVLTAGQCFPEDPEMNRLARRIYERVDFKWMLNGDPALLSHGWRPETGFIKHRWDRYSEHTILYLMAIGSPTHPIAPDSWYAWERPEITYKGFTYIGLAPLFTHQYSHAWVDYRRRREERGTRINYFQNSITATRAHRAFCLDLAEEFPSYSENIWGISASDSQKGYVAWGGPPRHDRIDGTVVPYVAAGSMMFTPDICLPAVREMYQRYGDQIYGQYGFADAFNPLTGWVDTDVIGIDLGITLLGVENSRTGQVWKWFMQDQDVEKALELVGLTREPD